jgi:hypothetical protein
MRQSPADGGPAAVNDGSAGEAVNDGSAGEAVNDGTAEDKEIAS